MVKSNRTRTAIAVIAVLWGIIGVIGLVPAGLSVMIFDAPGSEKQSGTIWLFRAIASFPFVCFFTAITTLILNSFDRFKLSIVVLLLPLINVAIGGAAVIMIDQWQGGRFGG